MDAQDFEKIANEKADDELLAMLARPNSWHPGMVDAAKAELQKRSVAIPQAAPAAVTEGGKPQNQGATLTITITTDSGTRQYSEPTVEATARALRADILQGTIPRDAKAVFETKVGKGKPRIVTGTSMKCAARSPQLGDLYVPVRRHARAGMGYGILVGVLLYITILGFVVYQTNDLLGEIIMALPVCFAAGGLLSAFKINLPIIQTPLMIAAVIIPGYLGLEGVFPMLVGAAAGGALLFSMPGMAIGAIVGTVRRSKLPRAYDAPHENAFLRIAIPLVIGTALWVAYLLWARSFLQNLMK